MNAVNEIQLKSMLLELTALKYRSLRLLDDFNALRKQVEIEQRAVTVSNSEEVCAVIQQAVANYYGLAVIVLTGRDRREKTVWARHVAMVLAGEHLKGVTTTDLASMFGGRDHAMIAYAKSNVAGQCEVYAQRKREVESLRAAVNKILKANK